MSSTSDRSQSTASDRRGALTPDERETFEFLAERFEGEKVGELAELVLQSCNEEANS
jgi:hypothetical protein